jgi:hypothetical protein
MSIRARDTPMAHLGSAPWPISKGDRRDDGLGADVAGGPRFLTKPDQNKKFGGARYGWKMMGGKLIDVLGRIP